MSVFKQLGQAVDSVGNTATEIYALPIGIRTRFIELECSNVTGSDATVRVYQDADGESYTAATALYYDYPVAADSTVNLEIGPIANPAATIAVSSSVASAVTFTLHGQEVWYGIPADVVMPPGRARIFESGNTEYLSAVGTAVTDSLGSETTVSMSAWIKIDSQAGLARSIMGMFSSDLNDKGYFEMQLTIGGVLRVLTNNDSGLGDNCDDSGATDLRDGEWHHVACARDGANQTVWVDGGAGYSEPESRTFPTIDTLAVGCRVDSTPSQAFEGDIDECTYWFGRKLTDADAAALYALGVNSNVLYLPRYQPIDVPLPSHHYSLSLSLNPGAIGLDEVGSVDLTDNGTEDVEGIPAGEGRFAWNFTWSDYENIMQRHDFTVADEMLSDGAMTLSVNEAVWDSFAVKSAVPLSITAGYKTSNTAGLNVIAALSDINETEDFLYIATNADTDTRAVYQGSGAASVSLGDGDTADGAKHFMGAAITSSNIRCWVDGNAGVDESHSQTPSAFDTTSIGVVRISGSDVGFFNGTVDNVAFWNRAITDDEYTWLYNSNTSRTFKEITESADGDNPGVSALSAFYSNTEVPGEDRVDGTGNGNELTQILGTPGATFGLDQLEEYTTTGSYVRKVNNLQGNGGQLVQATLLNRPSWQTIGGDDVLHFNGTNDNLKGSASGGPYTQPNTIFIVCKIEDNSADQKLCDGSGAGNEQAIGVDDGNTVMTMDSGTVQEMTLTPDYGNIHVWCAIFDGASSRLYKDGGTADTVPASCGTESWNGVTVGAQYNAVLLNAKAEIYYYVMASGELSLSDINDIGEELASLAGTAWSTAT